MLQGEVTGRMQQGEYDKKSLHVVFSHALCSTEEM